jgi:hypothetical protein
LAEQSESQQSKTSAVPKGGKSGLRKAINKDGQVNKGKRMNFLSTVSAEWRRNRTNIT